MDRNRTQNGRGARENGEEVHPSPPSRMQEVASRGYPPTAEVYGRLVHAGITDVATGVGNDKAVAGVCRGVKTFIQIARNIDPINDLCRRIAMSEKEQAANEEQEQQRIRQERVAALEAELATLKS